MNIEEVENKLEVEHHFKESAIEPQLSDWGIEAEKYISELENKLDALELLSFNQAIQYAEISSQVIGLKEEINRLTKESALNSLDKLDAELGESGEGCYLASLFTTCSSRACNDCYPNNHMNDG